MQPREAILYCQYIKNHAKKPSSDLLLPIIYFAKQNPDFTKRGFLTDDLENLWCTLTAPV